MFITFFSTYFQVVLCWSQERAHAAQHVSHQPQPPHSHALPHSAGQCQKIVTQQNSRKIFVQLELFALSASLPWRCSPRQMSTFSSTSPLLWNLSSSHFPLVVFSTSGIAALNSLLIYFLTCHRWKQPDLERPIKVNIVLPIVFFIVCSFLILMPVFEEPEVSRYQLESVNNLRFKSDFRLCVFMPILVRLQ